MWWGLMSTSLWTLQEKVTIVVDVLVYLFQLQPIVPSTPVEWIASTGKYGRRRLRSKRGERPSIGAGAG